jgi:hypothetical protein
MPNTETIAITLQKICNGFPLILKTLAERHGLFRSPSNWRHTVTHRIDERRRSEVDPDCETAGAIF